MSDNNPNDNPAGEQEPRGGVQPFDESLLSAFLDDELAAPERAKVLQRLAIDPSAKATLESMQQVRSLVSDLPKWTGPLPDLSYSDASDDDIISDESHDESSSVEDSLSDDDASHEGSIVLTAESELADHDAASASLLAADIDQLESAESSERVDSEQDSGEAERAEQERLEAERLDAEAAEQERIEQERIEAERVAAEKAEAERVEAERLEAERVEQERLAAEQAEAERLVAERVEQERLAAERAEQERLEQERFEAERVAAEQAEAERVEAERIEQERIEAERVAAEQAETERLEAERVERERLAAEQAEAQRLEAERIEQERFAAEQAEAERLEAERVEQERIEAERVAAEKAEAERLEAERVEQERLVAEQAEQERLAAEQAEQERIEAERIAAEQAEAERLEAERLEEERLQSERAEQERLELEQAIMASGESDDVDEETETMQELAGAEAFEEADVDPVSDDEVEQFIAAHRDAPESGGLNFGTAARALAIAATLLLAAVGGYMMWPAYPKQTADASRTEDATDLPSPAPEDEQAGQLEDAQNAALSELENVGDASTDSTDADLDPFAAELEAAMGRSGDSLKSEAMPSPALAKSDTAAPFRSGAEMGGGSTGSDAAMFGTPEPSVASLAPATDTADAAPEMLALSPPGSSAFADSLPPVLGPSEIASGATGGYGGNLPDFPAELDGNTATNALADLPDLSLQEPAIEPAPTIQQPAAEERTPSTGIQNQLAQEAASQPRARSASPPMSRQDVNQLIPDPSADANRRESLLPGQNYVFHSAAWQENQLKDAVQSIAPLVGIGRRRLPTQLIAPVGSLELRGESASSVAEEVAAVLPAAAIAQTPNGEIDKTSPRSLVAFVSDVEADAIIRELSVKRRKRLSAAWLRPSGRSDDPRAILIIGNLAAPAQ